jgi:EAL domain-containing protein (putative c-di-GMP-specific phosphodiesterase class I)/GGDEF domain-containing protein
MTAEGDPNTLLLLGPETWADTLATALLDAWPELRVSASTDAGAVLHGGHHTCVVARLAAETPTNSLVTALRAANVPLLLVASDDAPRAAMLELMDAGAAGLVRDGAVAALMAAVRRCRSDQQAGGVRGGATAGTIGDALRALADQVQQPLALVCAGNVLHLNPACRRLFALPVAAALEGGPVLELAAPESAAALRALLARALLLEQDSAARETLVFTRADGPAFAAEVTAAPLALDQGQALTLVLTPTRSAFDGPAPEAARRDDRDGFWQRLAALADDASPVERMSALAVVQIADYAEERGRLGLTAAASLVQACADRLRTAVGDSLYRIGDDIFAVLAEDVSGAEVGRLRRRLREASPASGAATMAHVRLRVGVVAVTPGSGEPAELLNRALRDAAMAQGTTASRPIPVAREGTPADASEGSEVLESCETDNLAFPDARYGDEPTLAPSDGALALARATADGALAAEGIIDIGLTAQIPRPLEQEGFTLAFQPIVSLMGDSREHYSVLMRLRQPDGTLCDAAQIIDSAGGSGRMADIDRWVISSALQLLAKRQGRGEKASFFISLSPEIVADDGLLIWLCDALRACQLRGSCLTFQMQEQHAKVLPDAWAKLTAGLREIRCRTCINQHGLADLPDSAGIAQPDFVKLAPSLVAALSQDKTKQRQLMELVRRAKAGGVQTIVTGVEDLGALSFLWEVGIDYVQGNYLQAPETSLDLPPSARPAAP